MRRITLAVAVGLLLGSLLATSGGAADTPRPPIGETKVWAPVPDPPGNPEGIAIRKGIVYIGTHAPIDGDGEEGPSRIFKFSLRTKKLLGSVKVKGQAEDDTHGILGMAFDAAGRLYVLDRNPARLLRFSRSLRRQKTYARFPDLHPCQSAEEDEPCSPTEADEPPFPDYFAFDKRGNAYVTDLQAATIFKVPPGGGKPKIWFSDPRLDSVFGPNGIALDPSRKKVFFAMTGSLEPSEGSRGIIYWLPLTRAPKAEDLKTFFIYEEPAAGPDGIAFGKSGKLYVVLAGGNQISVLRPDGSEQIRFPGTPAENEAQEVPYDLPASVGFNGKGSILVTNQSFFADNSDNMVVLDAWVNDTALGAVKPRIP